MPLRTEVGLGPGDIVLDEDAATLHRKGHNTPPALFGPCLLWPNSCPCQQLLNSCTSGRPKTESALFRLATP